MDCIFKVFSDYFCCDKKINKIELIYVELRGSLSFVHAKVQITALTLVHMNSTNRIIGVYFNLAFVNTQTRLTAKCET